MDRVQCLRPMALVHVCGLTPCAYESLKVTLQTKTTLRAVVLLLMFLANAAMAQFAHEVIPASALHCADDKPPAASGLAGTPGGFVIIHPRNDALTKQYTGCKMMWVVNGERHHKFATLYFNAKFQEKYRSWWKAVLTTPSPTSGKRLIDEPALFGAELINEDSFFFWTFNDKQIPDLQLKEIERQFGEWLKAKYGSFDKTFAAWKGQKVARDNPDENRIGFRPLWNIAHERTQQIGRAHV